MLTGAQAHLPGDLIPVAKTNHFTILDELRLPNSNLTRAVLQMAEQQGRATHLYPASLFSDIAEIDANGPLSGAGDWIVRFAEISHSQVFT